MECQHFFTNCLNEPNRPRKATHLRSIHEITGRFARPDSGEIAMRRPLDWIVVSILLLVLSASRVITSEPPALEAPQPGLQAMISNAPAPGPGNPFAWIQEDGSLVYLPAPEPRVEVSMEAAHRASTAPAIYTWSSAPALADETGRTFQ